MKYSLQVGSLLLAGLLVGCNSDETTTQNNTIVDQPSPVSPVLVTVNDSPITERELEHAINRTLGESAVLVSDPSVTRKVLDSLVASRAMAMEQELRLSAEQLADIETSVRAYREEVLVRAFITDQAEPEPVTPDMVLDYYQKHPEEFGGSLVKSFEVLTLHKQPEVSERKILIDAFQKLEKTTDWQAYGHQLAERSLPIRYQKLSMQADLLDQPMKALVETTDAGQVSPLNVAGQLMRVKVLSEHRLPVKPLEAVSADIRQKLAPIQFRKTVKKLSKQALEKASVTYVNASE